LHQWNATHTDWPGEYSLLSLFQAHAEQQPDSIAILSEEGQISYAELNQRANRLAHFLRQQGVGPDVLVPVILPRTPLLLVALLGVLKAGGAYVPLDPDYPAERLAFILSQIQAPVLL